ncbi:efflux RND transporter periplasmic adaptor subunit [Petrotoga sp. 9PWA.NaAc.5.4]|uniref:efflux RND transporter periplasmic adaptor subunit n=1 Tax=Petrotoga sp. 9PWA.NaAc.5.4 TaxID=1434328 RepID=UPI000CAC3C21|nr:efflux RND transporter periplasmic adaptor subunit [Petrotoga sp. 9PWA.NaAc.5.4]PNR97237.1 hypothetical protein X924_01280 [Petrotoga sp. 9PWA.NaAc.5.4]
MKKRGKIIIWAIVIVAVIVIGIIIIPTGNATKTNQASGIPPVYLEYKVKSGEVGDSIEVVGNVEADVKSVYPKVSGEIVEIYVEKGDFVEKGQVLAKIDDLQYQTAYLNALNDYESSTNLAERMKEVKRLQLEQAKKNLESIEITAPISGIISQVNVSEGTTVNTSTAAFTIVDKNNLKVSTKIDEIDFPFVEEGMEASVKFNSLNLELPGKISWISPVSSTDVGIVVIPIEIELENIPDSDKIVSGMTADVEIVTLKLEGTVAIPKDAIQKGPNNVKIVYKKTSDGGMEPVQIETGRETDTMVEVISGLRAEDTILILPSEKEIQRLMQQYGISIGIPTVMPTVPAGGSRPGRGGF